MSFFFSISDLVAGSTSRPLTRQLNEHDLAKLEKTDAALQWKDIGRRLPHCGSSSVAADAQFAFSASELDLIANEKNGRDRECLRALVQKWKNMSRLHNVKLFVDAMQEANLGGIAETLFAAAEGNEGEALPISNPPLKMADFSVFAPCLMSTPDMTDMKRKLQITIFVCSETVVGNN